MTGQEPTLLNFLQDHLSDLVDPVVALIIALVGGAFAYHQWRHRPERTARLDAFGKLHSNAKETIKNHQNEGIFFQEDQTKPKSFSSKMTLVDGDTGWRYTDRLPHLRGSYLITGEAGCGKSEILKNDFYKCYKWQSWRWWFYARICVYYLDAEKVLELIQERNAQQRQELLERISKAELTKLILYVDGVDELSDSNMEQFELLLDEFKSQVNMLILRFTCRTEFAKKHLRKRRFDYRFMIEPWSQQQLKGLSEQILKCIGTSSSDRVEETREYICDGGVSWSFINSPLLLKLLLYIKIYGQHDVPLESNKYSFYSVFFRTLISVYRGRIGQDGYDIDDEIDQAAEAVFTAYVQGEKMVPYIASLGPLIKCRSNADSSYAFLTHETFYEYLVARYYHLQFQKENLSPAAVDVMSASYSNDYADFISAAFIADGDRQQITAMDLMCRLYRYTLLPTVKEEFSSQIMTELSLNNKIDARITELCADVNEERNPFLTLKYEIIFRFGRFSPEVDRDRRIRFLKFVYENDDNTCARKDPDYFAAVLKRCCAISASFLGGEEIELDYVSHMLDFGIYHNKYDENYDLANRSHTLVYYSDVPNSNIYTFRDNQAENPWSFARAKRIERLAVSLPDDVAQMTPGERKKFYFRVFDIATIYTFLRSREHWELSAEERRILTEFKTRFTGMSDDRRKLLDNMKEETLRLLRSGS